MITPDVLADVTRLLTGAQPRMLMLGAQESQVTGYPTARAWFRQFVGDEYDELDLADGDLRLDLNADLIELSGRYRTVFNLGTLEHVWDANRAWCNAMRAVAVGGNILTLSPVGGWCDAFGRLNHGVHMTTSEAIHTFLARNGFTIRDTWDKDWRNRGRILYLRAEKVRHIENLGDFAAVYQVRGFAPAYRSTA